MKKTTRIKASSLRTRAEFDAAVDQLARTTVELRKLEAARDEQLQRVRATFDEPCADRSSQIDGLALAVEKYAEEHRDELFTGKVKSSETALALFGFRFGQPTLKTLNKAWTWDRVLEQLDSLNLGRFIRTKRECDKDAMKQHLDAAALATVGCRIDQAETFFVEPKEQATAERSAA
jgi:phage host-nuclease inhibitor protein Gam